MEIDQVTEKVPKNQMENQITVFYDGLCQLCSREISHYKKMKGARRILFVDITAPQFDAEKEGLDPRQVHRHLHAKDSTGKVYKGVDSFILIWSQLDSLQKIVPVASLKPVKKTLELGYAIFVQIRPLLPRKKCSDSPYCDIKN